LCYNVISKINLKGTDKLTNLNYVKELNKKNKIKCNSKNSENEIQLIPAHSKNNSQNTEHKNCNHDCANCKCKHQKEDSKEQ
jgi:hypothetical protein